MSEPIKMRMSEDALATLQRALCGDGGAHRPPDLVVSNVVRHERFTHPAIVVLDEFGKEHRMEYSEFRATFEDGRLTMEMDVRSLEPIGDSVAVRVLDEDPSDGTFFSNGPEPLRKRIVVPG